MKLRLLLPAMLSLLTGTASWAQSVSDDLRHLAPELEKYSQKQLMGEVWKRPALSPRDRSIVTLAALIARNQTAEIPQIPYHLNQTMDNGLTQTQAGEAIAHQAFYVGWPNAFSALPVAKDVFEKRPK